MIAEVPNPVLAEVVRGDFAESVHRGSAVAVTCRGDTVFSAGDVKRHIYPRSAIKLFQALPLVESGAADRFGLGIPEIALACASHSGEPIHVETVSRWLAGLGLSADDLENGPDMPLSKSCERELVSRGEKPSNLYQNCSGKHAGMLTMARYLKVNTAGYIQHDHPVQRAWMNSLSSLVETDIAGLAWEQDGCGMPAICMPLETLAFACALYANPQAVRDTARRLAISTILRAVAKEPLLLAGTGRCCTDIVRQTNGRVLVKTGAEAVYAAIVPSLGLGLALKIDDGGSRASTVVLGALLKNLGAISDEEYNALSCHFTPAVYNTRGHRTGTVVPSRHWSLLSPV